MSKKITHKAPSGRTGTYIANGDPDRIQAITSLLLSSITTGASAEQHLDNMHQAAACLTAELEIVDSSLDDEHTYAALGAILVALGEFLGPEEA
jgi:hypothetical protein